MRAPALLLACALASLPGCVAVTDTAVHTAGTAERARGATRLVAVFPVENLSGKPAPLDDVRRLLVERLTASGFGVLADAALERVAARHRVRYMAGVEAEFARALGQEAGVEAILIPSLEVFEHASPPRIGLFARLVSTGEAPVVLWVDGTGAAGDDAPGILGLGLVEDSGALLARAVDALAGSLVGRLAAAAGPPGDTPGARKFQPKIVYRAEALDPARTYSIAVVPFFNRSARKYAGEIVALHLMRSLVAAENLSVVEPGIVRQELLRFRIIMTDGVSLADTETILGAVNADLVLNGEVLEYQDPLGPTGAPRVDFSVLFIERRTRRVLYSSYSHNAGDDGVFFFDWGRVNTAHAMAARMARAVAERVRLASPTAELRRGPRDAEPRR